MKKLVTFGLSSLIAFAIAFSFSPITTNAMMSDAQDERPQKPPGDLGKFKAGFDLKWGSQVKYVRDKGKIIGHIYINTINEFNPDRPNYNLYEIRASRAGEWFNQMSMVIEIDHSVPGESRIEFIGDARVLAAPGYWLNSFPQIYWNNTVENEFSPAYAEMLQHIAIDGGNGGSFGFATMDVFIKDGELKVYVDFYKQ
ncbi:hypothetical protein [Jeotgalibacillus marinus]|uniref:Uncharacterized protein n=1 Tax=Jeotgalibacillus marinus TaxID=86667 RepID=A0ABV3Q7F1_9BACL